MTLFDIYAKLPVFMQDWIVWLYSVKIEMDRGGKEYEEILQFLQTADHWSSEQIISYKEEHIARILEQAYRHCAYYKHKYDSAGLTPADFKCLADLQKFPILTKEEIRENYDRMIADNVRKGDMVHYHTSGSSGKALDFCNSKRNLKFYWAVVERYKMRFGVVPHSLSLNFNGKLTVPLQQSKPPYWRFKRMQNQYLLPMQHITREKVPSMVDFINSKAFETLVGYPSICHSFSSFVNELGLRIKSVPKFYFSGAEKVYEFQADAIEKAFPGLRIIEHFGFSENAGSASKCIKGHYHEDFELGHFELSNPVIDGHLSTGTLLSTGFHNFAMPFIRYEVGDTLTFDDRLCECGMQSQVIKEVNGRNEDYVITPEGSRIMRFDYIFKDTRTIRECQVVQKKLGEINLRIVRRDNYSVETEKEIEKKIHTLISPTIKVVFEYVDEIPRTKAGKFKAVVSEINKQ